MAEILVDEGDSVAAGDVLLQLARQLEDFFDLSLNDFVNKS